MRLNVFIAKETGLSRRASDQAISGGKVMVNGRVASLGQQLSPGDKVRITGHDNDLVYSDSEKSYTTILLNKPEGYVCSRAGQGNKTIYELLPEQYHSLKPVGRLDKDSSGLILLTDDGQLANKLTHPRYEKTKIYEIAIDKPLAPLHQQMISDHGVMLEDGLSKLSIQKIEESGERLRIVMSEGRNRQIRRTFEALGYNVTKLHRSEFGSYTLGTLETGKYYEEL